MFPREFAQQTWFDQAVSWSSSIRATIAISAVMRGIWVASTSCQALALTNRRYRWIWPAARDAGICTSRIRFIRSSWALLSDRIRSGSPRVRDELVWLSDLHPITMIEPGLSESNPVRVPFTFAPSIAAGEYDSILEKLSDSYDFYGSSVRRRWLLRATAGPLITQEYECAKTTAGLLMRWASFEPIPHQANPGNLRGRLVELADGTHPRNVRLVTWPNMEVARPTPVFPVLGASFQPYRVVMEGSPVQDICPDPENIELGVPGPRGSRCPLGSGNPLYGAPFGAAVYGQRNDRCIDRYIVRGVDQNKAVSALGFAWDSSTVPDLPAHGTRRAQWRFSRMLPEYVWDAAVLEGNPFTYPEVQTLLEGVTVGGRRSAPE
jgi:hypothetical protein